MPIITSLSPTSGPASGFANTIVPGTGSAKLSDCVGFHRQHRRYLLHHRSGHGACCGSPRLSWGRRSVSSRRWVGPTTQAPTPVSE